MAVLAMIAMFRRCRTVGFKTNEVPGESDVRLHQDSSMLANTKNALILHLPSFLEKNKKTARRAAADGAANLPHSFGAGNNNVLLRTV